MRKELKKPGVLEIIFTCAGKEHVFSVGVFESWKTAKKTYFLPLRRNLHEFYSEETRKVISVRMRDYTEPRKTIPASVTEQMIRDIITSHLLHAPSEIEKKFL